MLPGFICHNTNLAFFALVAIAASGFGQAFFVSVFGGALRAEFALSHVQYGGAALASAVALLACGGLIDHWPLRRSAALVTLLLATAMSPLLAGVLLDRGIGVAALGGLFAVLVLLSALLARPARHLSEESEAVEAS